MNGRRWGHGSEAENQREGAIYHVTLRGIDRRETFEDLEDCERIVRRMSGFLEWTVP